MYKIELQNPIIDGSEVYSARVMLGIDAVNSTPSFKNMMANPSNSNTLPVVGKIYPNPTKDEAYIDYQLPEGQKGTVSFYNITGQLLSEYTISNGSNKLTINTATYKSGIYFYKVLVNDNIIENEILIIIK